MRKIITFTLALLALTTFANGRNDNDVVLHQSGGGNGLNQIYIEPPYVTYDENLNELYVYFGTTSSIDLVYNHDHIPYIFPLLLQNCNINNSQYVYASSFSAGNSVVPNITHGNVTIKNGAVYEIEATDDVLLGEGFIVENGATFAVKTPGKVMIDGCVFQSGAKVKIEAGNVEVVGKFTDELGSMVEFTQFVDD